MFRRKSRSQSDDLDEVTDDSGEPGTDSLGGPWDVDEVPDDGVERIDLGSLLVPPTDGTEVRLQVDEQTGQVQSVMLAGEDGALELRAFAAPRNGDLWSEVRPQISADVAQHGGTATERDGRWGVELVCNMQVVMPDGTQGIQPSRIVGVNGTRWLLRGTFLGRPAVETDDAEAWEDALASVVVRRGDHAMPVGDALPLVLPPDAQRTT
ncbi:DUF3710 domain-containing protein [Nocardioides cynanchi]|uniref:DUF3710 domain-containing protein n=1 Tax=Nocardioides cynanchi TaxID=2558918 RepID=UPI001EE21824|nr:DUF3710 domain-containing protein [Nocardioides cynanchi]